MRLKLRSKTGIVTMSSTNGPGIGTMTATALVATVGNARDFKNGRELAAWLGLVPRQHSSGGKSMLLGMSKRGDVYLRTLLIHGARSLAYRVGQKANPDSWLYKLMNRRNANIAAVAQANKTARIVWAMLFHGLELNPNRLGGTPHRLHRQS